MTGAAITIGMFLIKMGAVGGFSASVLAGIKWFSKFDPKLKGKKLTTGGDDDDSSESIREKVRSKY